PPPPPPVRCSSDVVLSVVMLLWARQRLAPWPGARLSLWNADTLAAHAHSADIIWLNNALHRLLPEDPGLLATLQQLAVPGALLYG
ncbi:class I SAM-dependent methyltransferase, partial [Escherichia coli]|uniref:class I SAM-dependent methyltransferase n=1 Tax=Escherichia coli TaxID=562 RepID=UPI0021181F8E